MTDNSGDTGAVRGGDTGAPAEPDKAQPTSRASALFDLRKIIGGMLSVYGVVLIIVGLLDGKKQLDKADGIHINLWTGIGMLVVGVLFLVWSMLTVDAHESGESEAARGRH